MTARALVASCVHCQVRNQGPSARAFAHDAGHSRTHADSSGHRWYSPGDTALVGDEPSVFPGPAISWRGSVHGAADRQSRGRAACSLRKRRWCFSGRGRRCRSGELSRGQAGRVRADGSGTGSRRAAVHALGHGGPQASAGCVSRHAGHQRGVWRLITAGRRAAGRPRHQTRLLPHAGLRARLSGSHRNRGTRLKTRKDLRRGCDHGE